MRLVISKHPSGGFLLNIPTIFPQFIKFMEQFYVWRNESPYRFHVQMEFTTDPFQKDIDFFEMWLRQTILVGRCADESSLTIVKE